MTERKRAGGNAVGHVARESCNLYLVSDRDFWENVGCTHMDAHGRPRDPT